MLADPEHYRVAPTIMEVPILDFTPLDEAAAKIQTAAAHFAQVKAKSAVEKIDPSQITEINRRLIMFSRSFLRKGGLPGRPYYENELYSPGRLWDTVPVPAVGDAMLDGDWKMAAEQVPLAAGTLLNIAHAIDAASEALEGSSIHK